MTIDDGCVLSSPDTYDRHGKMVLPGQAIILYSVSSISVTDTIVQKYSKGFSLLRQCRFFGTLAQTSKVFDTSPRRALNDLAEHTIRMFGVIHGFFAVLW